MDFGDVSGVLSEKEEDYLEMLSDEVCEDVDDNYENFNNSNCGILR